MAMEKSFEEEIKNRVRLQVEEQFFGDADYKCRSIFAICNNKIFYWSGAVSEGMSSGVLRNPRTVLANIDRLPNLKRLIVSNPDWHVEPDKLPPSIEFVSLRNKHRLAALNDLPKLTGLGIMHEKADLAQFPALRDRLTYLSFINVKNEEEIGSFGNLETLTFGTLEKSCNPLGKLKKLHSLSIEDFKLETFDGLEGCENLVTLRVQTKTLADVQALSALQKLRRFTTFGAVHLTDISPLAGLSLETLELPGCSVTDFTPLAGMKKLKHLDLSDCLVEDLSWVEGLENLTEINLTDHAITRTLTPDFYLPLLKLPNLRTVRTRFQEDRNFPTALCEKLHLPDLTAANCTQNRDLDMGKTLENMLK